MMSLMGKIGLLNETTGLLSDDVAHLNTEDGLNKGRLTAVESKSNVLEQTIRWNRTDN